MVGTGALALLGKAEGAGLALPGEGKASENLIATYQYQQGGRQEDDVRLFTVVHRGCMRYSTHKLKQERLRLGIRITFHTMWALKQWNRLAREVVQFLSLKVF